MTHDANPPSAATEPDFSPLRWRDGVLLLLDQTRLPDDEIWLRCARAEQIADAIRRLAVRGAPAIGVAAGYGLVLAVSGADAEQQDREFEGGFELLGATRPTAVNLRWALERGRQVWGDSAGMSSEERTQTLLEWAEELQRVDVATNRRIGEHGRRLFSRGDRVLTHCNTGALATAGYGTALGLIRAAWDDGRLEQVWVDETRPLLQGARLTTWELGHLKIPYRLITDSSAGALMARGMVQRVVVGADRIAANGDVANKIGTYTVAVLAARHEIPFYVAAPLSTIDPHTARGEDIPIEERDAGEVTAVFGTTVAPAGAGALNLAFDVTPAELVTAIITEVGVLEPPYATSIARALET